MLTSFYETGVADDSLFTYTPMDFQVSLGAQGCETRAGPYPYCWHIRHGVYSVTKSLGAAVASNSR